MKHLIFTILLLICAATSQAQELTIKEFREVTNDLSARTQPRQDNNGDDCALVKVQLAASNATFSGNVMGDVAFSNNEYWVYMTAGSKRLKVNHPSYLPLEVSFADYGVNQLKGKMTYVLTLILGNLPQGVQQQRVQTGWILVDSEPQGAAVYINEEFVGNTPLDGYKQAYGVYTFRVERPNYHPAAGTIELNSGRWERKITLQPAFGSISVNCNVAGATVMLDGKATGQRTPCTLQEVASGQHSVTVQMEKYAPRQASVVVEDGKTAEMNISLDARFATISIASLNGAQIMCNGKQIGTTKVDDDMMEGFYDIEARLAHHKTVTQQIQVVAGQPQQITLNPIPIYGSLDIVSNPRDAAITIDGKLVGNTPFTVEQILEGNHVVTLKKEGYTTEKKEVVIKEGLTESLSVPLEKGQEHQSYTNNNVSKQGGENIMFTVNGVSFTMVPVEGGTFTMGAPNGWSDEKPVHLVTLSSYYIGETEVTQELWQAVMGTSVSEQCDKANLKSLKGVGNNYPMYCISWDECQEFIRELNALTGKTFRLPTEAEWEFAARGGNQSQGYSFSGGNDLGTVGWYNVNSGDETHPVKTKKPNELGIYDMSGNVEEWCQDWNGAYNVGSQTDPTGPTSGSSRVYRGGGYNLYPVFCRVSQRSDETPGYRHKNLGLRLALESGQDGVSHTSAVPNSLSFDAEANTAGKIIWVTSNEGWTATSNASWCKVSPDSGTGSGRLTVTVIANTSTDSRMASVTVRGTTSGNTTTIDIVQSCGNSAKSKKFNVDGVSFNMIKVECGTFQMGSASGNIDERPVHQVTLTKNYYIGETEVTQELWQAVMGNNPSDFKGSNRPVESVSWDDCQVFIRKLNSLTGKNFRLPTEAEWEFAARGGNKSQGYRFSGGNDLGTVGWYRENSGDESHPVKTKKPNERGIYDMSGNVEEWCQDWYGAYNVGSQTDPTGPTSGSSRVYRGGGWPSIARSCRVSDRSSDTPGYRSRILGLRLAL